MKTYIWKNEWWPVYTIDTDVTVGDYEVSDDLLARYKEAEEQFAAVQDELRRIYDNT